MEGDRAATHNGVTLHLGDCLDTLPGIPDASIDAIITDPPYGLADLAPGKVAAAIAAWLAGDRSYVPDGPGGFMGRDWDRFIPPPAVWDECLRVLKPGGHLAVFAAPRTVDLMGLAIRLAGFEIRDSMHWINGSGFPKSLDVSKAIDKAAGAQREVVGLRTYGDGQTYRGGNAAGRSAGHMGRSVPRQPSVETTPATEDAARWQGFGTALKPAHEPIVLARKPLAGTVAANVLEHGTGALNIAACRVDGGGRPLVVSNRRNGNEVYGDGLHGSVASGETTAGRWPSNVVLSHPPLLDDHHQPIGDACADRCVPGCPVAEMDRQSGVTRSAIGGSTQRALTSRGYKGGGIGQRRSEDHELIEGVTKPGYTDEGGASRFFPVFRYQPKAPARERPRLPDGTAHPTVKPLELIRWLTRLLTPPGGTVLDPFAGSGTTGEACTLEGFNCHLIEREPDYAELTHIRLNRTNPSQPTLDDAATLNGN